MEFPDLVYRGHGPFQRNGGGWDYRQVNNDEELEHFLASGWHTSQADAIEAFDNRHKKATETQKEDVENPLTRSELEKLATLAGIKFDGRTSDKMLREKVTEWDTAKSNS